MRTNAPSVPSGQLPRKRWSIYGSAPLEHRLALLFQRLDRLGMIGGADGERLVGDARVHNRMGDALEFEVGQHLGVADGGRGSVQQALAEGLDGAVQLFG